MSGSSISSTRLTAPRGPPDQASGGDSCAPSGVWFLGMAPRSGKLGELNCIIAPGALLPNLGGAGERRPRPAAPQGSAWRWLEGALAGGQLPRVGVRGHAARVNEGPGAREA